LFEPAQRRLYPYTNGHRRDRHDPGKRCPTWTGPGQLSVLELYLPPSADSPEIVWWMEALTEWFPDATSGARNMFLAAFETW